MIEKDLLLVAVNVSERPFDELAVIGTITDLPAGMLALGMGSITGAPKRVEPTEIPNAQQKNFFKNVIYRAEACQKLAQISRLQDYSLLSLSNLDPRHSSVGHSLVTSAATRFGTFP